MSGKEVANFMIPICEVQGCKNKARCMFINIHPSYNFEIIYLCRKHARYAYLYGGTMWLHQIKTEFPYVDNESVCSINKRSRREYPY